MDYETVCRLVGHLWLSSEVEKEKVHKQAHEAVTATRGHAERLEGELAKTKKERDDLLLQLAGRVQGEAN